MKNIYFKKFGKLSFININQNKYISTIITKTEEILKSIQLKHNHNTIKIGEININISELKLVLKK
jgi:hypothetical protein